MSELADQLERELHQASRDELLAIGSNPRWQRDRFRLADALNEIRRLEQACNVARKSADEGWQEVERFRRLVEQMREAIQVAGTDCRINPPGSRCSVIFPNRDEPYREM